MTIYLNSSIVLNFLPIYVKFLNSWSLKEISILSPTATKLPPLTIFAKNDLNSFNFTRK